MISTREMDKPDVAATDAVAPPSFPGLVSALDGESHLSAAPGTSLPSHCQGVSLRAHVQARIDAAVAIEAPFRHLFIENIFPEEFYEELRGHMLAAKHGDDLQERHQDNQAFKNKRFSLAANNDLIVDEFKSVFMSPEIKNALLAKFYFAPFERLTQSLIIHDEFEYFFTKAGRFQNIHVDIPPKYLSFVFYIPEEEARSAREEMENATILYDAELMPHYSARFRRNSVCVFAPHFQSYHGFNSTLDRDVLVMFYVDPDELDRWRKARQVAEAPPFEMVRDVLEDKFTRYQLLEYGLGAEAVRLARNACRINAPQGRVIVESS